MANELDRVTEIELTENELHELELLLTSRLHDRAKLWAHEEFYLARILGKVQRAQMGTAVHEV